MSEYMQGGALASDDLDFSASSDRGRASEHASTAVKSPALNVAIGVSAVVMVVGLVLWFMQLSGGMVQTAMRNLDSWGLYITGFMFFVGLSAGGLIISSVPKALGIRGFGGMVFAVSPMNAAPDCVHPLARDFADFLRLLLACGDAARRLPGQKGTVDVYVKDQPLLHPAPSFGFRYVRSSWFRKQYNTNFGNMRTKFRKFYRVR